MWEIDTWSAKERLRKALNTLRLPHYQCEELFQAINELVRSSIADERERGRDGDE